MLTIRFFPHSLSCCPDFPRSFCKDKSSLPHPETGCFLFTMMANPTADTICYRPRITGTITSSKVVNYTELRGSMSALSLNQSMVRGVDLPYEDGVPLESSWHLDAMYLLINILSYFWRERRDVYIGGNMFVYFDPNQVKTRNFRGPDLFVVKGVTDNHPRQSWVVWEEDGLTPDFVIELASESTVNFDLTGKKEIYEQMLKTPEYIVYDPNTQILHGWRLTDGRYTPLKPNEHGRVWCHEIGLWLGVAEHRLLKHDTPVKALRFFDDQGHLIPTEAEAEVERLRRLLADRDG